MPIRFDCPNCKANYEVADDLGGKMIMCRLCQKRGLVRSSTAKPSATVQSAAAAAAPSRRNFLLIGGGVLASLAAIATGAGLAQWRPWRHWGDEPEGERRRGFGPPGGRGGPPRDRKGPPPGEGKDQNKGPGA